MCKFNPSFRLIFKKKANKHVRFADFFEPLRANTTTPIYFHAKTIQKSRKHARLPDPEAGTVR
jgi:hypothetical protein